MSQIALNRGLSQRFLDSLHNGDMAPVLGGVKQCGLDLQIREGYINVYDRGRSLLKLGECRGGSYRAEIHVKYLPGVSLPGEARRNANYATFAADALFAQAWAHQLAAISDNSQPYAGGEACAEQSLVRCSQCPDAGMLVIDRQIQVHGIRTRADVIGITRETEPRLIIGEVKVGLNNDIQKVLSQLDPYFQTLADHHGRLAQEAATVYERVLKQKQFLGVAPTDFQFPPCRPRVECLVILCDYKPRSELLARARQEALNYAFLVHLAQPEGPDYCIPPVCDWEQL